VLTLKQKLEARRVYRNHAWGVTSIVDYAPDCATPCQQARQLHLDEIGILHFPLLLTLFCFPNFDEGKALPEEFNFTLK
jgi:hypothetical protein